LSPGFIVFYSGTMHVDDVAIYNNTIEGRGKAPGTCIWAAGILSNFVIKNNILSGCDNAMYMDTIPSGTFSVDSNLFYSNTRLFLSGSNDYRTCIALQGIGYGTTYCDIADPKFVAVTDGAVGSANLNLQSSSPAINHGQNLSATFTNDLNSITRTGPWDIGAYEYTTNQPCTSFTYSCSSCQSNNTMACSVISASPSYCTGGNPVLTQSCTYTPNQSTPQSLNITSTSLTNLTRSAVTTNWVTDNSSTGRVIYGTSLKTTKLKTTCRKFNKKGKCQTYNYTKLTTISKAKTLSDANTSTSHNLTLTNLQKNKTYYYQIIAQSGAYTSQTSILRFKTLKK